MVMEMVIFAAATANLAPMALPGPDSAGRCERELARIAKAALFVERAPAKAGKRPAANENEGRLRAARVGRGTSTKEGREPSARRPR
jgi:hypothetical protein